MSLIANTFNEFVLAVKNALGTDEKPVNFRAIWQDHDYYFGTYTYATSRFQSMTISSATTSTTYHVLIDSNSVTAHQIATNSDLANNIKVVRNDFSDVSVPTGNFSILLNATAQSGYKAVGIVGWSTQNRDVSSSIFISTISVDISTQTIQFLGRNTLNNAYTLNPYFNVLYVKE